MVSIRLFEIEDYHEVAQMYHDLLLIMFPHHVVNGVESTHKNIDNWITYKYDIMVTYNDTEVTGFGLSYIDDMGGTVAPFYQGEIIYVKAKYRKGRSAYLMYKTMIDYADSLNMIIATNSSDITESSRIGSKLGKLIYSHYERLPNV